MTPWQALTFLDLLGKECGLLGPTPELSISTALPTASFSNPVDAGMGIVLERRIMGGRVTANTGMPCDSHVRAIANSRTGLACGGSSHTEPD